MTKQKIVIKVSMAGGNNRAKAMTLVSGVLGVTSVAVTGDLKDRLEVVGEGVDAASLVSSLRKKKLGHVELLTVEEVKDEKKEKEKQPEGINKPSCPGYPYCYCHPIGPPPMVVYEDRANYGCSIL